MGVVLEDPVQYQLVVQHASVTECVMSSMTVVPILKRQDAFQVQTQQHLVYDIRVQLSFLL